MSSGEFDITGYEGGCDASVYVMGSVIAAAIIVVIIVVMFLMGKKGEGIDMAPLVPRKFSSIWATAQGKRSPSLRYAPANVYE